MDSGVSPISIVFELENLFGWKMDVNSGQVQLRVEPVESLQPFDEEQHELSDTGSPLPNHGANRPLPNHSAKSENRWLALARRVLLNYSFANTKGGQRIWVSVKARLHQVKKAIHGIKHTLTRTTRCSAARVPVPYSQASGHSPSSTGKQSGQLTYSTFAKGSVRVSPKGTSIKIPLTTRSFGTAGNTQVRTTQIATKTTTFQHPLSKRPVSRVPVVKQPIKEWSKLSDFTEGRGPLDRSKALTFLRESSRRKLEPSRMHEKERDGPVLALAIDKNTDLFSKQLEINPQMFLALGTVRATAERLTKRSDFRAAKVVVVVESESEKAVVTHFLKRLSSLNQHVYIWVLSGEEDYSDAWCFLKKMHVPYFTLIDLHMHQPTGGWIRIKQALRKLLAFHGSLVGVSESLTEEAIYALPICDTQTAEMPPWLELLERHGIFFSTPLNFDSMLYAAFSKFYKIVAIENDGQAIHSDSMTQQLLFVTCPAKESHEQMLRLVPGPELSAGMPGVVCRLLSRVSSVVASSIR